MPESSKNSPPAVARAIDWLSDALGILAGGAIAVMTAVVVYDVVARYFFNAPTSWAVDLTEILMLPAVYLALAYTTKVGGHVNVDMLVMKMSPKAQERLAIVAQVASLVFASAALWSSWNAAVNYFQRWPVTMAASIPQAPAVMLILLGVAAFFLQTLLLLWTDVIRVWGPAARKSTQG